ncbi:uncharacterized protein METZ01_LOCUS484511, partial [marine metagenome]
GNNGTVVGAVWSTDAPTLQSSGGTLSNIRSWSSNSSDTSVTVSGLSLSEGGTYTVSVRATDTDNQLSDTTTTDGVTIDVTVPAVSSVMEGPATPVSSNTYSLNFDGADDYVSISGSTINNTFSGLQKFTVFIWVYGDAGGNDGNYRQIIGHGQTSTGDAKSFQILKENDGSISYMLRSNGTDQIHANASYGTLNSIDWNQIAVTYSGGTDYNSLKMYVNGTPVSYYGTNYGSYSGMNTNT